MMDALSESRPPGPRYRVITELGAGGTADVFLALADETGDDSGLCVLKTPRRGLSNEEELLRMFRRESRLAARLRHPNIVEVFEILEDRGQPVLVMEFLEGASLRELQRALQQSGRQLALREQIEVLESVCHGLSYCHELRDVDGSLMELVHRDVSPHNIFVTFDGRVKVLDFGIAKLSGSERDTETGIVKGKLRYMAPEHMMGAEVDRRADVYAMGVLLWESIAGRPMWDDVNDAVLMQRTVAGEVPDPHPLAEGCTPRLVAIARRALSLHPADRFPSCDALADALEEAKAELPPSGTTFAAITTELFDERRQRLRDQVRRVQDGSSPALSQRSVTGPIEWHHSPPSAGTLTLGRRSETLVPSRRSSAALAAIAVGSAALAALVWVGVRQTQRHTLDRGIQPKLAGLSTLGQDSPRLDLLANESPAPDDTPGPIRVSVRVEPSNAVLELDGQPVSPPFDLTVPRDLESHILTVSAPGYQPLEQTVRFDRDLNVSLRLDREVAREGVEPVVVRRPRRPPPPRKDSDKPTGERVKEAVPPAQPVRDCDPPFVLDDRGFKKFKRECL